MAAAAILEIEKSPYLGRRLTGLRPSSIPSGVLDPCSHLAATDMGRKLGEGCAPLGEGELGPHLTQCGYGRGLPECQVST